MVYREGVDVVITAPDDCTGFQFLDLQRIAQSLAGSGENVLFQYPCCSPRSPQTQWRGTPAELECAYETYDSVHMVGMEVREENVVEREGDAVAHHLALRTFTAVEKQCFSLANECEAADTAFHGRTRRGCAQKANR